MGRFLASALLLCLATIPALGAGSSFSDAEKKVAQKHGLDPDKPYATIQPQLDALDQCLTDLRNPAQPAAQAERTAAKLRDIEKDLQAYYDAVDAAAADPAAGQHLSQALVQFLQPVTPKDALVTSINKASLADLKAVAAHIQQGSATDAHRAQLKDLLAKVQQQQTKAQGVVDRGGNTDPFGAGFSQFLALLAQVKQGNAAALAAGGGGGDASKGNQQPGPQDQAGQRGPPKGRPLGAAAGDGAPGESGSGPGGAGSSGGTGGFGAPPGMGSPGAASRMKPLNAKIRKFSGEDDIARFYDRSAENAKALPPAAADASMQGSFGGRGGPGAGGAAAAAAGGAPPPAAASMAEPKRLRPDGIAVPKIPLADKPSTPPAAARAGLACAALLGAAGAPVDGLNDAAQAEAQAAQCGKDAALAQVLPRREEAEKKTQALVADAVSLLEAQRDALPAGDKTRAAAESLLAERGALDAEKDPAKRARARTDWLSRVQRLVGSADAGPLGQVRRADALQEKAFKKYSAAAEALLETKAFRALAKKSPDRAALAAKRLGGEPLEPAPRAAAEAVLAELSADPDFAAALAAWRKEGETLRAAADSSEDARKRAPALRRFETTLESYRLTQLAYLQAVAGADSYKERSGERVFVGLPDADTVEVARLGGRQGLIVRSALGAKRFVSNDGAVTVSWYATPEGRAVAVVQGRCPNGALCRVETHIDGEAKSVAQQGRFDANGQLVDGAIYDQLADGSVYKTGHMFKGRVRTPDGMADVAELTSFKRDGTVTNVHSENYDTGLASDIGVDDAQNQYHVEREIKGAKVSDDAIHADGKDYHIGDGRVLKSYVKNNDGTTFVAFGSDLEKPNGYLVFDRGAGPMSLGKDKPPSSIQLDLASYKRERPDLTDQRLVESAVDDLDRWVGRYDARYRAPDGSREKDASKFDGYCEGAGHCGYSHDQRQKLETWLGDEVRGFDGLAAGKPLQLSMDPRGKALTVVRSAPEGGTIVDQAVFGVAPTKRDNSPYAQWNATEIQSLVVLNRRTFDAGGKDVTPPNPFGSEVDRYLLSSGVVLKPRAYARQKKDWDGSETHDAGTELAFVDDQGRDAGYKSFNLTTSAHWEKKSLPGRLAEKLGELPVLHQIGVGAEYAGKTVFNSFVSSLALGYAYAPWNGEDSKKEYLFGNFASLYQAPGQRAAFGDQYFIDRLSDNPQWAEALDARIRARRTKELEEREGEFVHKYGQEAYDKAAADVSKGRFSDKERLEELGRAAGAEDAVERGGWSAALGYARYAGEKATTNLVLVGATSVVLRGVGFLRAGGLRLAPYVGMTGQGVDGAASLFKGYLNYGMKAGLIGSAPNSVIVAGNAFVKDDPRAGFRLLDAGADVLFLGEEVGSIGKGAAKGEGAPDEEPSKAPEAARRLSGLVAAAPPLPQELVLGSSSGPGEGPSAPKPPAAPLVLEKPQEHWAAEYKSAFKRAQDLADQGRYADASQAYAELLDGIHDSDKAWPVIESAQRNWDALARRAIGAEPGDVVLFHGIKDVSGAEKEGLRPCLPPRCNQGGLGLYMTSKPSYASRYGGTGWNSEYADAGGVAALRLKGIKLSDIPEIDVAQVEAETHERLKARGVAYETNDSQFAAEQSRVVAELTGDAPVVRLKGSIGDTMGGDELVVRDPRILADGALEVFDPARYTATPAKIRPDPSRFPRKAPFFGQGPLKVEQWTDTSDPMVRRGKAGGQDVWVKGGYEAKETGLTLERELALTRDAYLHAGKLGLSFEVPDAAQRSVEGKDFLVIEHMEGRDLFDAQGQPGAKISRADWDAFVKDYTRLAEEGLVHGDLTRLNVRVETLPGGRARLKLIDWERGKQLGEPGFEVQKAEDLETLAKWGRRLFPGPADGGAAAADALMVETRAKREAEPSGQAHVRLTEASINGGDAAFNEARARASGLAPLKGTLRQTGESCAVHAVHNLLAASGVLELNQAGLGAVMGKARQMFPGKFDAQGRMARGLALSEVIDLARSFGNMRAASAGEIFQLIAKTGKPVLAGIDTGSGGHAVVVEGLFDHDGKSYVSLVDSNWSNRRLYMPVEDFALSLKTGGMIIEPGAPTSSPGKPGNVAARKP